MSHRQHKIYKTSSKYIHKSVLVFIQQGHIKLIKNDSKDMYNVTKRFIFQINAVLLFLSVNQQILKILCITFSTKIISIQHY